SPSASRYCPSHSLGVAAWRAMISATVSVMPIDPTMVWPYSTGSSTIASFESWASAVGDHGQTALPTNTTTAIEQPARSAANRMRRCALSQERYDMTDSPSRWQNEFRYPCERAKIRPVRPLQWAGLFFLCE